MNLLRIATRKSPLALKQAETVKTWLLEKYPELNIELVGLTTKGDRLLEVTLNKIGGKGLFIKELEQALLDGEADIAVHSMKDMPAELLPEFTLAAICKRDNPYDVFVSNTYQTLEELPQGAKVGTSSLRREAQLKAIRPDLAIQSLRGNIHTRLQKLDNGEYDAIILAAAGLLRMGLDERISSYLSKEQCLPAVAQGALGIECLTENKAVVELIQVLQDADTLACVTAERAVNKTLQGSCQVPLAVFAELEASQQTLQLEARIGWPDGSVILSAKAAGSVKDPVGLGLQVAKDLLAQGADEILSALRLENAKGD